MVVRARVAIRILGVDGCAAIFLGQELLDFPVVHSGADGKLEIFLGDGVPVLQDDYNQGRERQREHWQYVPCRPS